MARPLALVGVVSLLALGTACGLVNPTDPATPPTSNPSPPTSNPTPPTPPSCPTSGADTVTFFDTCLYDYCGIDVCSAGGYDVVVADLEAVLGPATCGTGGFFSESCSFQNGAIEVAVRFDPAGELVTEADVFAFEVLLTDPAVQTATGLGVGVDAACFETAFGPSQPGFGAFADFALWFTQDVPSCGDSFGEVAIWPTSGPVEQVYLSWDWSE